MKRRNVQLHVSDHAVLCYLERRHGIDVDVVRRHLAGLTTSAAQLGALAVRAEHVRILLRDSEIGPGQTLVTVATVVPLSKPRPAHLVDIDDD